MLLAGLSLGLQTMKPLTVQETVPRVNTPGWGDDCLRAKLLADIPGLATALLEDRLEGARLLLNWAANTADFAISEAIARQTTPTVSGCSAGELYYDVFLPNKGGVYCGGTAVYYDKILKLFDYNSFTVDFGDLPAGLTHVTVVIGQWEESAWEFYLFDPTFNVAFCRRADGRYAPIEDLIAAQSRGLFSREIVLDQMLVDRRDFLALRTDKHDGVQVKEIVGDFAVCSIPGYGLDKYFKNWRTTFLQGGYSPNVTGLIQLFRTRVFRVGKSLDERASRRFHLRLREHGIPVGPSTGT
jgi:hypothetical protein